MKSKIYLALTVAVGISILIALSSDHKSIATSTAADIYLGRITFEIHKGTQVNIVNSQDIEKYTGMQDAIAMADKQYEDYQRLCSNYPCGSTTSMPAIGSIPHFQLAADLANAMINDPSYGFRYIPSSDNNAKLYPTYIKYANATYGMLIIMK